MSDTIADTAHLSLRLAEQILRNGTVDVSPDGVFSVRTQLREEDLPAFQGAIQLRVDLGERIGDRFRHASASSPSRTRAPEPSTTSPVDAAGPATEGTGRFAERMGQFAKDIAAYNSDPEGWPEGSEPWDVLTAEIRSGVLHVDDARGAIAAFDRIRDLDAVVDSEASVLLGAVRAFVERLAAESSEDADRHAPRADERAGPVAEAGEHRLRRIVRRLLAAVDAGCENREDILRFVRMEGGNFSDLEIEGAAWLIDRIGSGLPANDGSRTPEPPEPFETFTTLGEAAGPVLLRAALGRMRGMDFAKAANGRTFRMSRLVVAALEAGPNSIGDVTAYVRGRDPSATDAEIEDAAMRTLGARAGR